MLYCDIIIISIGVFGCVQLILVILFWFFHLQKHRNHPIYSIRHPILWQITVSIFSSTIIIRAIFVYLSMHNCIHRDIFISIETFCVIVLLFGLSFSRSDYIQIIIESSTLSNASGLSSFYILTRFNDMTKTRSFDIIY